MDERKVVVVGAGVVGLACAHYLSRAGWRVTVIERETVGSGCSHANCGYISPSHVAPLTEPGAIKIALKSLFNRKSPFRVKPTLNPALLQWMIQFGLRCHTKQVFTAGRALQAILDSSIGEYRKLVAESNLNCQWRETGMLFVFRNQKKFESFGRTHHVLADRLGVPVREILGGDLLDFEPGLRSGLYGGFHYPGDAMLKPDLLLQSWHQQLAGEGVQFQEHCELHSVSGRNGRIESLQTSRGEFKGEQFVFAMGALSGKWSQKLGVKVPVQPGKGYSLTMARPENGPTCPMLFPEEKVGVTPFDNHLRLGSMMEFVGYDSTIPAYRIQQLREAAKSYLVASVEGPAEEEWFGWRPMTWDSLPIIGPMSNYENGFLATGHNMLGLSLAPATGRLIAELINHQPTHLDPTPYSPNRF